MYFFQFLIYSLNLAGTRMSAIADTLRISSSYLSQILSGRRRITESVSRELAEMFRVRPETLSQLITPRAAGKLVSDQIKARSAARGGKVRL